MRKSLFLFIPVLASVLLWTACSKKTEPGTVQNPEKPAVNESSSIPSGSPTNTFEQIATNNVADSSVEEKLSAPAVTNSVSTNNTFHLMDRWQPDIPPNDISGAPVFITNRFASTITSSPNIKIEKFRDMWAKGAAIEQGESLVIEQTNKMNPSIPKEEIKTPAGTSGAKTAEDQEKELLEKMKNPDMTLAMIPKMATQGETSISETMKARSDAKPTITILCYHQFDSAGPYSMKTEEFRQNLQEIKARGFTVIPMSHVVEYYHGKRDQLPEKSLVITIDDGYRSVYLHAYPLLKEYGFPWVFYIYSDFVNSGAGSVTWEQLKEMSKNGMELGSHSKSHPFLPKKGGKNQEQYDAWLDAEIVQSRKVIEEKTGVPVQTFAYPYGAFDKYVRAKTIQAGYEGIVTVVHANNFTHSDPMELNRFVMTKGYSITQALNAADKNLALPLANLEPSLGSHLPTAPQIISATLPSGYTTNATNISMTIGENNINGFNYDPATQTLTLTNLPPGLKDKVILKVTAKNDQTGQKQTGTWYFNVLAQNPASVKPAEPVGASPESPPTTPHQQ